MIKLDIPSITVQSLLRHLFKLLPHNLKTRNTVVPSGGISGAP
jgi:hypothetical protein